MRERIVVLRSLVLVIAAAGCGAEMPATDGAVEDGGGTPDAGACTLDADCADDLFCNGAETCVDGACVRGSAPCAETETCDEASETCAGSCDADADAHESIACGGDDCDDEDAAAYPGAVEFCDASNRDEDCDPRTFGFRDADGDGYADSFCCNGGACGNDCDDQAPGAHPGEAESCDGFDNDCDDELDEGVTGTFYVDTDRDRFGDAAAPTVTECFAPAGYVDNGDDCDDTRASVHPGAPDICDTDDRDDDCSGVGDDPPAGCECDVTDPPRPCTLLGECRSGVEMCTGGTWGDCSIAPQPEACNMRDEDCDGTIDNGVTIVCYPDADNDGFGLASATSVNQCPVSGRPTVGGCQVGFTNLAPSGMSAIDCDDTRASVAPGTPEVCDFVDNDCDGATDDGVGSLCWADGDRDGWAAGGAEMMRFCGGCPMGQTARDPAAGADCDDTAMTVYPGAIEACDAIDQNCNGTTDDVVRVVCWTDGDNDTFAPSGATMTMECPDSGRPAVMGCPDRLTNRDPASSTDCDDASASVYPMAPELCDAVDQDCDGSTADVMRVTCWPDGDGDAFAPTGVLPSDDCPDPARMAFGYCPGGRTGTNPATNADCDDANGAIHPAVVEVCQFPAMDQNCNGNADEGILTCYRDQDGDTYGANGTTIQACPSAGGYGGCPSGYSIRGGDCSDGTGSVPPTRYPGAPEICDGYDNDCAGLVDEGMPCRGNIVISEVDPEDGSTAPLEEFVEVYNRTDRPISMAGVELQTMSSSGSTFTTRATAPAGAMIPAYGFFLFASTQAGLTADASWTASGTTGNLNGSGGHVRLYFPPATSVIDLFGWGSALMPEGTAMPESASSLESYERKQCSTSTAMSMNAGTSSDRGNSYDTNNNANDFVHRASDSPQRSTSTPEPPGCEAQVRLVGSSSSSGRLEIFHTGMWGTVCNDSFTVEDAQVVCRQLGLTGGTVRGASVITDGTGTIWMDELMCVGTESRLAMCPFPGWGVLTSCTHADDIGVACP